MGAETVVIDDSGTDGDLLAEQLDLVHPVHQTATQRAFRLEAHEHDGTLRPPKVVLQMVADAPGVAHTGGGNDDLGGGVCVQRPGLVCAFCDAQPRELKQSAALKGLDGLLIQIAVEVAGEDSGGLARQGRVHVDLKVRYAFHKALLLDLPGMMTLPPLPRVSSMMAARSPV